MEHSGESDLEPVVLYGRAAAWGLPSLSPACTAVEAYLRLAHIPMAVERCASSAASPSGVLPAAEAGDDLFTAAENSTDEWLVAESIVAHLKRSRVDLDEALPAQHRGASVAFFALVDKTLAPATVFFTWVDDSSWWQHTRAAYGEGMPFPVSYIVPYSQRRAVTARFRGTDRESIVRLAASAYEALEFQLTGSHGPFLFGSSPSSLDAFVFSHLLYHRNAPGCVELQREFNKHRALLDYVQQLHSLLFSTPAPPPPVDNTPPSKKKQDRAGKSSGESGSKARTEKEERLKRRGRVWLGFAAGVVLAYVLLSGRYIDVDTDFFYEDDDEED